MLFVPVKKAHINAKTTELNMADQVTVATPKGKQ